MIISVVLFSGLYALSYACNPQDGGNWTPHEREIVGCLLNGDTSPLLKFDKSERNLKEIYKRVFNPETRSGRATLHDQELLKGCVTTGDFLHYGVIPDGYVTTSSSATVTTIAVTAATTTAYTTDATAAAAAATTAATTTSAVATTAAATAAAAATTAATTAAAAATTAATTTADTTAAATTSAAATTAATTAAAAATTAATTTADTTAAATTSAAATTAATTAAAAATTAATTTSAVATTAATTNNTNTTPPPDDFSDVPQLKRQILLCLRAQAVSNHSIRDWYGRVLQTSTRSHHVSYEDQILAKECLDSEDYLYFRMTRPDMTTTWMPCNHPSTLPLTTTTAQTFIAATPREKRIVDCIKAKGLGAVRAMRWYNRVLNPEARSGQASLYDQEMVAGCVTIDDFLYYGVKPDGYEPPAGNVGLLGCQC